MEIKLKQKKQIDSKKEWTQPRRKTKTQAQKNCNCRRKAPRRKKGGIDCWESFGRNKAANNNGKTIDQKYGELEQKKSEEESPKTADKFPDKVKTDSVFLCDAMHRATTPQTQPHRSKSQTCTVSKTYRENVRSVVVSFSFENPFLFYCSNKVWLIFWFYHCFFAFANYWPMRTPTQNHAPIRNPFHVESERRERPVHSLVIDAH